MQQWLDDLGLGSKLDVLEAYAGGAETVADEGFQEFVKDGDENMKEVQVQHAQFGLQQLLGLPKDQHAM